MSATTNTGKRWSAKAWAEDKIKSHLSNYESTRTGAIEFITESLDDGEYVYDLTSSQQRAAAKYIKGLPCDWYERRGELSPGMVFEDSRGEIVRLDRRVPGDGTQWYADAWYGHWSCEDVKLEPGDLVKRLSGRE